MTVIITVIWHRILQTTILLIFPLIVWVVALEATDDVNQARRRRIINGHVGHPSLIIQTPVGVKGIKRSRQVAL